MNHQKNRDRREYSLESRSCEDLGWNCDFEYYMSLDIVTERRQTFICREFISNAWCSNRELTFAKIFFVLGTECCNDVDDLLGS